MTYSSNPFRFAYFFLLFCSFFFSAFLLRRIREGTRQAEILENPPFRALYYGFLLLVFTENIVTRSACRPHYMRTGPNCLPY